MCYIDKRSVTGRLWCKICGQRFEARTNALSAPVDIYSEWVDACEAVASKAVAESAQARAEISDDEGDM